MDDFGIPYSYSPVVMAKREDLTRHKDLFSKFVRASQKGFLNPKENLNESLSILKRYVTAYDLENIDLEKSISFSMPHFGDDSNCGTMKQERVSSFLVWLVDRGLEDKVILNQSLFTNELFE